MGLIKAVLGAAGGTLADQWKEFFYCDALPKDVIVVKGSKRISGRSSNTKGSDNIITNGSGIAVADGQCMIIVDQGQVVEICAVPGEYTYDMSSEPSIFSGNLGDSIKQTFKTIGKRIGYGGDTGKDQRVYYFNTKELIDNKFGTQNPVPFRVSYEDIKRSFTVGVRCNGVYSYKIADPLLFYTNVCGNVERDYTRAEIDSQLKSEFLSALQPAFAKLSAAGVRYDEIPAHTLEISDAMNEALTSKWHEKRGITVVSVAINSVTIPKEDEDRIKKYEDMAWNRDPGNAAATLVGAQAEAMTKAAGNSGGAMMGFMGLNMAQQAGGLNAQNLFNMSAQQDAAAAAANSWKCSCGTSNTGKFCANCGKEKPVPAAEWECECGTSNTGKFCANCGKPRPAASADGWTCSCGAVNKGKFCAECGAKKPAGAPLYKCDKCGWEPQDPYNPPKFCAECGDPFNDDDIQK
ncbi:MAG: SPFH domain-containing protein [Oscillospiraceae bacterium]|nr:SPFH domain-containing protein [Oscillospiraceae bacterium]